MSVICLEDTIATIAHEVEKIIGGKNCGEIQ
jgi:hypothetical protein